MKALCLLAALCLAATAAPAQEAARRPIGHEDVWLMKRVGTPALSPDGRLVVVPVAEPAYDDKDKTSDLWLVPADGSAEPRQITFSASAESGVAWSPDSRRIAFSAKREGQDEAQVFVLDIAGGGEAERVTDVPTGASRPLWRPDGARHPVLEHDLAGRGHGRGQQGENRREESAQVQRARLRGLPHPALGPLARRAPPDADAAGARRRVVRARPARRQRAAKRARVRRRPRQRGRPARGCLVAGRQHPRLYGDDRARPGGAGRRAAVAVRDAGGRW